MSALRFFSALQPRFLGLNLRNLRLQSSLVYFASSESRQLRTSLNNWAGA